MYIVADIGGTKTRVARSRDLSDISEPVVYDTPKKYAEALERLVSTCRNIAGSEEIHELQIGIRGYVSKKDGLIRDDVLTDWTDKLLVHDLRVALSIGSVHLENDVANVAMGEAHYGAGVGAPIMVYITVSTGSNGCRIVDGSIDRSSHGFETGSQYVNIDPTITFEDMVSGTAVNKAFGKHPKDLGKDHEIWEELARLCAFGIHNTIVHWSPDRVVLGGSMFNPIGISVERVAVHVKEILKKFPVAPEIVHSKLGDLGGLWGGLALIRQRLESDPF